METIPDMINAAFRCGSVRVVRGKKPEDSLLCASKTERSILWSAIEDSAVAC